MSKKSRKEVEAIVSGMGVFTSIISCLTELVKKSGGTMENIYRLATPEGSETLEAVARIIAGKIKKIQNEYLNLISIGKTIKLDAVDGLETLANAKDVFLYIDSDLKNWDTDKKGPVTDKTPVQVYEMAKNANFAQMFGSLSPDLHKLLLTQAQIKNFARKHRNWLRTDGYATFFLFKENNHFFVAYMRVRSDGSLGVDVLRFEDSRVWHAGRCDRVVVPQLA